MNHLQIQLEALAENQEVLPTASIQLIGQAYIIYKASKSKPVCLVVEDLSRSTNSQYSENRFSRAKRHRDIHDAVQFALVGECGALRWQTNIGSARQISTPPSLVVFTWHYNSMNHQRDNDNLVGSMKPYRDAVARFFAKDDLDLSLGGAIAWHCEQVYEKGCERRVEIKLYWEE